MGAFRFFLDKQHKEDLLSILHFRLWMVIKKDKVETNALLKLINRAKKTQPDTFYSLTLREFGVFYMAAQYTLNRISTPVGVEYLEEMTGMTGRKKTEEWKKEYREYLMNCCMYFVNECNSKFENMREFVQLRSKIETAIAKGYD